MYISEIELNNFKSYQYQRFEFPPLNRGKHIILIGGLNGFGKTSLLEAIYLCLYGRTAIPHLGRAGISHRTYNEFIQSSYYAMATPGQRMSVRVDFQVNKEKGFSVQRNWFFNNQRNFLNDEVFLYPLYLGVKQSPYKSERLEEILDQFFVPDRLAPFFFFDGEEVRQIANKDKIEQVKQGMENLLGVFILRKLKDRLSQFQTSQRQQTKNVDEKTIKETEKKWMDEKEAYQKACGDMEEFKDHKAAIENKIEHITNRLLAIAGGRGVNVSTTKDLVEKQRALENEKEEILDRLDGILTVALPLSMVRTELYQQLTEQLEKEKNRTVWEIQKRELSPKRDLFIDKYIQYASDVILKLDEDDQATIKNSISKAWRDLFYPPQKNLALQFFHDYMTDEQKDKIIKICGTKNICLEQIDEFQKKIDELTKEIEKCKDEFNRIEGIANDGTLQKLTEDLQSLNNEKEQIINKINDAKNKVIAHKAEMDNAKASLEKMNKQIQESTPANELIDKAGRISALIDDLIPHLYSIKTRQLSENMTKIFKQLSHKQNISTIKVLENGETHFFNSQGEDVGFDRSAGEDQLFATTLLASLAMVSNNKAPLIVDTPLGRLDSIHRTNILNFWTSDQDRQVILLSQDEEIRPEVLASIEGSVLKKYILHFKPMGEGVGVTTVAEGYFGEDDHA